MAQSKYTAAGVDIHNHNKVKKGEILLTIYSENKKKLEYALDAYKKSKVVEIGP